MANRLKELRKAKGYSRYAFARALRVDATTVWRWENLEDASTIREFRRIAEVLQVAPVDIDPDLTLVPVSITEEPSHA